MEAKPSPGVLHFEHSMDVIMFSIGMFLFSTSFLCILYWLIKNRELLAMMAQPVFSLDPKNRSARSSHDGNKGSELCPDDLQLKSNSSSSSSSLASIKSKTDAIVTHTTSV